MRLLGEEAAYAVQPATTPPSTLVTVGAFGVRLPSLQGSPAAHGMVCLCCCSRGY